MNIESRCRDKPSSDFSQIKKATLDFLDKLQTIIHDQPNGSQSDAQPTDHVQSGTPSSPLLTVKEAAPILNRTEAAIRHMIFQAEAYSQLGGNAVDGEFLKCIARPPQTRRVFLHRERLLALVESWASTKTLNQQ